MAKTPDNKIKTVFEISAGGVVFKKEDANIFVLLIAVKNSTVWTLPKGLVEKGEDTKRAAIREVKEETGCTGEIIDFIDKVDIWFYLKEKNENTRHHKLIYYYLIKYREGSPKDHDFEVDDVKWFLIDEAIEKATYKRDRLILKKAKDIIYEKPNT